MVEEENKTKFPTPDFPHEFRSSMFSARRFGLYQVTEVDEWFKKCMRDSPIDMGISRYPNLEKTPNELMDIIKAWRIWYDKWFNQFWEKEHDRKEESQKDE